MAKSCLQLARGMKQNISNKHPICSSSWTFEKQQQQQKQQQLGNKGIEVWSIMTQIRQYISDYSV